MKIFINLIFVLIGCISCNSDFRQPIKKETATDIISHYYKNKYIDRSIVLTERDRSILDTVVLRLENNGEPTEVIQYIVNDYKLNYGVQ